MNAEQVPHGGGVEFDEFLLETWQAMNKACTGYWIADSEEILRQARDGLGRRAYEKLLSSFGLTPARPPGKREASKREALRRLRNYIGERMAMICYPQSRAKGWDIGSGPSEALCKTTAARLKSSGMRWDPAGAQAMLHLTALEDSNEWEAYWRLSDIHQN